MFGANSPNAIRMLQQLYAVNTPPPAPAPRAPAARSRKEVIRHVRPPRSPSTSSSDSDMSAESASTSSYDSYEEPDVIYQKVVKEQKCPYVSPAGLAGKKTKKEAVKYLKAKGCPDVDTLRKAKTNPTPPVETDDMDKKLAAPVVEAVSMKSSKTVVRTKKAAAAAVEQPKVEVKAPEVKATSSVAAAVAAEASKPKRELTAYQKFIQEQRKAGKSMTEAAAAWKASKGA